MSFLQMTGLLVVEPNQIYLEDAQLGYTKTERRELEKTLGREDFLMRKVELRAVPIAATPEMEAIMKREIKHSTAAPTRALGVMLWGPADNKLWIGNKTLGEHLLRHNRTLVSISIGLTGALLGEEIPIVRF
jgi:hypothetical protein